MGMLYKRGEIYWIKYYVNGRPIRESTRTSKLKKAEHFLKDREGRAAMGAPILPRIDRIRFSEAAQALREHYQVTGSRGLRDVDVKFKPVLAFFGNYRLPAITPKAMTEYVATRQAAGLTNGTINRELSLLGKALRLAQERGQLVQVPRIHLLKEAAPRAGFFERPAFEQVRRHLRPDLAVAVTIAYQFGWRMQSEVLTLKLAQVDLQAGTLRLDPGTTKNRDGRVVYLEDAELRSLLEEQIERVRALSRTLNRVIPFLFPNPCKGPFQGTQLRDFRKAWTSACKRTGLVGMLRHDFRRSAVRNLVNAGVPERVAMKVTGHKTRSIFDRYHIVSPDDLKDACRKITAGTITGTVATSSLAPMSASALNSTECRRSSVGRAAVS